VEHLAEHGSRKRTEHVNSKPGAHRPFTVVLTGGIASGKSTVSRYFEKLGATVIDTDIIAREVVTPGQPALRHIAKTFGPEVLQPDGSLDRKKLRKTIFSDPNARKKLESILHPLIREEADRRVAQACGPYCILVIPLYSRASGYRNVNRVLVVDVSEETQIQRVMERDGISKEQALAILDAQASRQERLAQSDDVIENSGDIDALKLQIEKLHNRYLILEKQYWSKFSS
jgi:dephospho-CoA kinase